MASPYPRPPTGLAHAAREGLSTAARGWLSRRAPWLVAAVLGLSAGTSHAFDLQFNAITDIDPTVTSGVLQYTVQIENSGFSTATDVRTVFAIPDGASVEGGALALPSAANANCSASGAFVVCSHGNLDGTGGGAGTPPISFTLRFRAPAALPSPPNVRLRGAIGRGAPPLGSVQAHPAPFFAAGSPFWAGDTNENNNAQSPLQQTTLENNADLSVAVTTSANPVVSGARLVYTVTVTNNGPTSNATTGVRVRNTLPAGATFVGSTTSDAGWSFSGPSAGVLTATRGTQPLAVGASVSFRFAVDVTIASGTLTNNAEVDTDRSVGGALLDNIVANNTSSVATTVNAGADLSLAKTLTSGTGPFTAGVPMGVRLAPRNAGSSAATSVVLRDVLPNGHTLAATFPLPPATQAFGSYTCRTNAANQDDQDLADAGRAARSILRCTRANLPVGDTENIDFTVVPGAGVSGSMTNTAGISAATADPFSANNSSSVSYTVLPDGADIEFINFDKSPNLVAATGGLITNTVRLRNNGPRAVDGNLQAFVALAAGESLLSSGAGWACVAEAGGARCTYTGSYPVASGATSGSGGFADLSFTTQASAAGALTSSVCFGGSGASAEATVAGFAPGSTTDFVVSNDCSPTRTVTATSQVSDLTVTKLTTTPVGGDKILGPVETSVTYALTVSNLGPTSTTGVVLRDTLPGYGGSDTVVSICGYTGGGFCTPPVADNFPASIGGFNCTRSGAQVLCSSGTNPLAVGAGNSMTFVIRMSGAIRDSLSTAAESGCSVAGQYCNLAFLGIDSLQAGSAFDPNNNNNLGQDTLVVHAAANIQTESKTFSPLSAQVGVDTDYTINYRNPAGSRSNLPALASPPAGAPAGVVFVDTFNLPANDAGFVLRSATIVGGAACTVASTTGGVVASVAAGGTRYATSGGAGGGAAGTVRVECPAVTMPRNTDRQVRISVRPNIGAVGPLVNTASFRIVDSSGATVSANGATYDLNTDSSAADDSKTASVPFVVGQVDLRVENTDLQDPAGWDPAAVNTSPGASDIVYRVHVRNGGPSLASGTRIDYTVTPPVGATIRFIGDEAGTAVTLAAGATAPQRCAVLSGSNPVVAPATLTLRCTSPGFGFTPNIDGAIVQGTLPSDGAFLNIRVRFESTPAPMGSTVSTNAVVSSAETELDPSNNAEAEITTVRTRTDLAISKTGFTAAVPALPAALPAAVTTVGLGAPFNWVVEVVNNGPGDALSVDRSGASPASGLGTVITDTLPAGAGVTGPITWQKVGSSSFPGAVTNGSGTCALTGLAVRCTVGDLANGGRVRVTLPVRWDTWPGGAGSSAAQTNSASAASEQVDPVTGNNSVSHVVVVTRSSLAGVVFEDRDRAGANAGTQQSAAADPPLANVTVVLRTAGGVDAYGNAFTPRTTRTDVNGVYRFDDLPAATFEVVEVQPANTSNSPGDPTAAAVGTSPSLGGSYVAAGADPAGVPVPAGANSRYTGVVLGAQQDAVRYNFPEVAESTLTPDLVVNKTLSPGALTELNRGSYSISVRNTGNLASSGVYTVTDTLPAGLSAVAGTTAAPNPRGTGWTCSVAGQVVTCSSSTAIAAGAANPSTITLDVQAGQGLCPAGYPCSLDNVVAVSGGGEAPARQPTAGEWATPPLCTTPASQNVCRLPTPTQQSGGVSGLVWLDADHDRRFTAGTDVRQPGFVVELYQAGSLLRTALTDAQGQYQLLGLVPGSDYQIRFRDAATGAYYGRPVSTDPAGGNDPRATGASGVVPDGSLQGFAVPGGNTVRINQNLPLDPSGVVYDSQTRQPVAGALVEFIGANGQPVPAHCVLGGVNRITTSTAAGSVPGGYAFWLVAPAPVGCPGDGNYSLRVTPPAGYVNAGVPSAGSLTATSTLIPAQSGAVQVPGSCQAYAAGAPCAVQNQATAPSAAQPTPYFFTVPLLPSSPAAFVDIVNNHIPLDPLRAGRFVISKQASRASVDVGDAVTYTINLKHLEGAALSDVRVDDRLPAGFRYVPGTFRIAGNLRADPAGAPGPTLRFDVGVLPINGLVTFTYVTRAGVGAQQGDGINTAQATAVSSAGSGAPAVQSNTAKARVRVTGGVFGAEACVVGKVYVDCNHNQIQDPEELGIPGVRLLLQDGTHITTDSEGKYSLCGLPPRTHVLKADLLTLPRGSRLVTSSSRNAGDANSIFIDLKNGELQRADFIEGSCSNTVLEQVKARRTQGEVRAVQTEKHGAPALKFEGKAPSYPQQGTDSANQQPAVRPRENAPNPKPPVKDGVHEQNVPVPALPAASPNTQRP